MNISESRPIARLTFQSHINVQSSGTAGPTSVNREAELERPSALPATNLLGGLVIQAMAQYISSRLGFDILPLFHFGYGLLQQCCHE